MPEVGIHDDFFELGGHSLLATMVVARARDKLGLALSLRQFFEAPTIAGLAKVAAQRQPQPRRPSGRGQPSWPVADKGQVRRKEPRARQSTTEAASREVVPRAERASEVGARPTSAAAPYPRLEVVSRDGPLPLSSSETPLWFIDQYQSGAANNVADAVHLRGPLDRVALERALDGLVARHESLRTRFVAGDGEPRRVIDPPAPVKLEYVELPLGEMREGEREEVAREKLEASRGAPFDLARGPVFRATLARLAPDDHVLLLAMHHIVSDGWSIGVLRRDLSALYAAFCRGEPSPLVPPIFQYADYAAWEQAPWHRERIAEQASYWKQHLAGVPALELPTDRPRPAVQSTAGATCPFELDAVLMGKLKALAQQEGATLFMTMLGAFGVLLSRQCGQDDFAIGTLLAHRTSVDLEAVVGCFLNTVALRLDLGGSPTVRQLLARARVEA